MKPAKMSSRLVRDASRSLTTKAIRNGGPRPLEMLPTPALIRSLLINSIISSPFLLQSSMGVLRRAITPTLPLFNPDRNPILRFALRSTAYDQFCAGTTPKVVKEKIESLRDMGYSGVILCYGRETVSAKGKSKPAGLSVYGQDELEQVLQWKEGLLRTLQCIGPGDFLAIKFSGAGAIATDALAAGQPMPTAMVEAMTAICETLVDKGARCWVDAEHALLQGTIDEWTIDLMRKYNRNGVAVVSNTIQAYLKAAPQNTHRHIKLAAEEGWILGIKLVRGAYIDSDPRHLIHDNINDTHACFDGIADDLINCQLPESATDLDFPKTQLFLATHNAESVRKTLTAYTARVLGQKPTVKLEFGQLQGMADDVSGELLRECRRMEMSNTTKSPYAAPGVYKYLTWGTVTECLAYLYRRSVENKGAVGRAEHLVSLSWRELRSRLWAAR